MNRVALLSVLLVVGFGCTRIGPGHAGIVVHLAGDDRGVDEIPVETGWVFYNPLTADVFDYPTFVQTTSWTRPTEEYPYDESITFNSGDGLTIGADISLAYRIDPSSVPAFYVKFRSDNLENFTDGYMRNEARSAFNQIAESFSADDIYGPRKGELVQQALDRFQNRMRETGVIIEQFDIIGAPRPPQSVLEAIDRKVRAVQEAQRAQNELILAQAEAAKKIATAEGELEISRKRAEQNRILSQSVDDRLLRWRQLELTEQYLQKWNGALPSVMAGESGAAMLYQIPNQ